MELRIIVAVQRIEVGPQGAREEHWVLGEDGESGTQLVQAEGGHVHAIDFYAAIGGFDQSEERKRQRGFAGPGPSHDPHPFPGPQRHGNAAEGQGEGRAIACAQVGE